MSKIYKDHQSTLPIGINTRQLAKEKKNQTQKSEPMPATFRWPVYTYTVDAGFIRQVHYSFINRMTVRYMIQYKAYNPNIIG